MLIYEQTSNIVKKIIAMVDAFDVQYYALKKKNGCLFCIKETFCIK